MAETGENIGPFLLGVPLGEGGFGAVYEATHQETGQRVALKFLRDSKLLEPEVQNRFVREIAILQRLDHDNIVRHYDAGLHDGIIYCAMELVDCGTLKEVIESRCQVSWREAAEVALQTCRALEHAHQHGCVHRDLKPGNLYLSGDGKVKLGDLGLARDLRDSRLTVDGQTVGTWRYMPPEQIRGEDDIDGRLDLYAMGCILFAMIVGRVPFDGPDFATIFDQHLDEVPPRVDVLVPDCPRELAELIAAMLEKEVENRPQNAQAVVDRLESLLAANARASAAQSSHDGEPLESERHLSEPNLTKRLHQGRAGERDINWTVIAVVLSGLLVGISLYIAFQD